MSYTLEDFATDCRNTLRADPGQGGQEKVLEFVRKALLDEEFVATNVPASLPEDRNVIYRDEELGFLICAHNNPGAKKGYPHDHGSTWAIYGQAVGETEMTDWKVVEKGDSPQTATKVELEKSYHLKPGDAHLYPAGAIHAPMRDGPTRLIRIEGTDTEKLERTRIEPA
ncbi:MAG: hypothetical protein VXW49_08025 [Pseudomonadota bacterium]|jgi:predicted metal-dependent enzyme (double-stranded beta helix superfamily)|nr:hypothetical protein [Pseudomonadota bacterium]MEC7646882.1 hypothetical protein [Pseudomonadota bacterium]MEC8199462.1 hypothetical protein [Pseudomonadota bacterium]MEC8697771.1 hypothetical protein [Pseudomonadota bacterium]MEC9185787.1 hypothetical protein [Pseudomonadota bacterium]